MLNYMVANMESKLAIFSVIPKNKKSLNLLQVKAYTFKVFYICGK